jgi:hypothetical protein
VCHPPRKRVLTRKDSDWTLLSHGNDGMVDTVIYISLINFLKNFNKGIEMSSYLII